jgi:hypothetical protein
VGRISHHQVGGFYLGWGYRVGRFIDLIGQRFGFWLVEVRAENNRSGQVCWTCLCDCGTKRIVVANSLRSGNSTSCGCNHTPDLNGLMFGHLKVLGLDTTRPKGMRRYWMCQCLCGKIVSISTFNLRDDHITSCGCETHDATIVSQLGLKDIISALILCNGNLKKIADAMDSDTNRKPK